MDVKRLYSVVLLLEFAGCFGEESLSSTLFTPGKQYHYDYASQSTLMNASFATEAQAILAVIPGESYLQEDEIRLTFVGPPSIEYEGNNHRKQLLPNSLDLSKWFSFQWNRDGTISKVYAPVDEDLEVLAFKKRIISLLSFTLKEGVPAYQTHETTVHGQATVDHYVEDGILRSVATLSSATNSVKSETIVHFDDGMMPVSIIQNEEQKIDGRLFLSLTTSGRVVTTSSLSLTDVSSAAIEDLQRPENLKSGSLEIVTTAVKQQHEIDINELLDCITEEHVEKTKRMTCMLQLVSYLSTAETDKLDEYLSLYADISDDKIAADDRAYVFLYALFQVDNPLVNKAAQIYIRDSLNISTVLSLLKHARYPLLDELVDDLIRMTETSASNKDMVGQVLLTLGIITRRSENIKIKERIISLIHTHIEKHTGSQVDDDEDFLATLFDALGNAGSDSSLQLLADHARQGRSLSVRHSAVRALRSYQCQQSASFLEEMMTDDTVHPSLQTTAAHIYKKHPRNRRDIVMADTEITNHHHHRRALQMYNVQAPSINWRQRYGRQNISTELSKVQLNGLSISADAYTTSYSFSLWDESLFSAHLELSEGDISHEIMKTQLCYEGTVTYDINMLNSFEFNLSNYTLDDYGKLRVSIQNDFADSVRDVLNTASTIQTAKDALITNLLQLSQRADTSSLIAEFNRILKGLSLDSALRSGLDEVVIEVSNTSQEHTSLAQDLSAAVTPLVNDFCASYPESVFSILESFPEVDDGAPLRTLNSIYPQLWSANYSLLSIEDQLIKIEDTVASDGAYGHVVDPIFVLYDTKFQLSQLKKLVQYQIVQHTTSESERVDLQSLSEAITNYLEPAIAAIEGVTSELSFSILNLSSVFTETQREFRELVQVYRKSRSVVDAVFGIRFNDSFPQKIRSCADQCGCGGYPSNANGAYNSGVQLESETSQVYVPIAGMVFLSPSKPLYNGVVEYDASTTVAIVPTDFNLPSHRFIIGNVEPRSDLVNGMFLATGEILGVIANHPTCGNSWIHLEAWRIDEDSDQPIDPTPFLQPIREPDVRVDFNCNEIVTLQNDMVVNRQILTAPTVEKVLVGEELIVDLRILPHEFPQPVDYVLSGSGSYSSSPQVQFFDETTNIMVGPLMSTFEFAGVGSANVSFSLEAALLSGHMQSTVIPSASISVAGNARVGTALYSVVSLTGTMIDGSLPSNLYQDWSNWPLQASASMDLVLAHSDVRLTTDLIQQTGVGNLTDEEILSSQTLWQYYIPPVDRNEYFYSSVTNDESPPEFSDNGCYVRQLPWHHHGYPAFELKYSVGDPESVLNVTLYISSLDAGAQLLDPMQLRGNLLVGPYELTGGERIQFKLVAQNSQGSSAFATCELQAYDRSPPLARINPRYILSAHPSQMEVMVALFDEFGLEAIQDFAVGTVAGKRGHNVLDWQPFSTDLIKNESLNENFSFYRNGRLVSSITEILTLSGEDCAAVCHNSSGCLSYDYSVIGTVCVLHSGVEGPTTDEYENVFETPPLRSSAGFSHFEKLGVGNSTVFKIANLTLLHGLSYFVNLRLRNVLGYVNVVSSPAIIVDFIPPEPGLLRNVQSDTLSTDACTVSYFQTECVEPYPDDYHRIIKDGEGSEVLFNGPVPLVDEMYTRASKIMSANWNEFSDGESGIIGYAWCIGTGVGECDVLPFQDPHASQSSRHAWTNSALASFDDAIPDGDYFITLQVESSVVYGGPLVTTLQHTTPFRVDTSPPVVTGPVILGYDGETNKLTMNLSASDDGSGIKDVSFALGSAAPSTDILQWTAISDLNSPVIVTADIPDGISAFVKVRATNRVDLSTVAVNPTSISVDRTPPLEGQVRDGGVLFEDQDFQSSLTIICVNIDGFSDVDSGISRYNWRLENVDSTVLFQRDFSVMEMVNQVACQNVALVNGVQYQSIITAFNGGTNEMSVSVTSNGVTTDITPPEAGIVIDGLSSQGDAMYSSCFSCVDASWSGFRDNESGIDHYHVTIWKKMPNSAVFKEIFSLDLDDSENSIDFDSFNFENGDRVKVAVEGFNHAGSSITVESSGINVDFSPPKVSFVRNGNDPYVDEYQYHSNTTYLTVSWEATDYESGIAEVRLTVYQVLEMNILSQVVPNQIHGLWLSIDPSLNQFTIMDLYLENGATYVAMVTFVNGAGLPASHSAPRVIIDVTPPVIDSLTIVGSEFLFSDNGTDVYAITTPDRVELSWISEDIGSGLFDYNVTIMTVDGLIVQGNVNFNFDTSGVIDGLALMVLNATTYSPRYVAEIVAADRAGLASEPVLSTTFVVVPGPAAGIVSDGSDPDVDLDYTYQFEAVSMTFKGFQSVQCGGIQHYTCAVGTGKEGLQRENLLSFTSSGLVVDILEGSGRSHMYLPNLSAYEGAILYSTVRGVDGCGNAYDATSDGFTIDTTPPVFSRLTIGGRPITLGPSEQFSEGFVHYQVDTSLSVTWRASDDESSLVNSFTVKVGTYEGGDDVVSAFQTDLSSLIIDAFTADLEDRSQYITIAVVNRAGLVTELSLPPIVVQTSPSETGNISCPLFIMGDTCAPQAPVLHSITCTWTGVHEHQAHIASYAVMIGSGPGKQDILASIILPSDSSVFVAPMIQYVPGNEYYVTLEVTSHTGLKSQTFSNAFYVETSPPVPGDEVYIQANYLETNVSDLLGGNVSPSPAECIFGTNSLVVMWSGFTDPESDVQYYQIGLGSSRYASNLLPFRNITANESDLYSYTLTNVWDVLNQIGDSSFYVSVRGFNGANMASVTSSQPLYVVTTANTEESWIYDGCDTESFWDIDYQTSLTRICAIVRIGVNCPVREVLWAVESVDGSYVMNFTEVTDISGVRLSQGDDKINNLFFLSTDRLTLYDDETYRVMVRITDVTGREYFLKSNGTHVTTRPLVQGTVQDGILEGFDLNFQVSTSSLSVQWKDFGDGTLEQKIVSYEVAVGTDRLHASTKSNILPFTNVGLATSVTFDNLTLVPKEQRYFVTVRAHATSGALVEVTSNGLTVGFNEIIMPGQLWAPEQQSSTSVLYFHWSPFESDVPIRSYEWGLLAEEPTNDILSQLCEDITANYSMILHEPLTKVGLDTSITERGLALDHGNTYYVVIRAVDESEKCLAIVSSGTVIDIKTPVAQGIYVGVSESRYHLEDINLPHIVYLNHEEDIFVAWQPFFDNETAIDHYEVSLQEQDTCGDPSSSVDTVSDFVNVGLQLDYVYKALSVPLQPYRPYMVVIKAVNNADLEGYGYSYPLMVTVHRPFSGDLKDGTVWEDDIVYQGSLDQIGGTFTHAKLQPTIMGITTSDPCPRVRHYPLISAEVNWSPLVPNRILGIVEEAIRYQSSMVNYSRSDPIGTVVTVERDITGDLVLAGAYKLNDSLVIGNGDRVSVTIRAALGEETLQLNSVSSMVLYRTDSDGYLPSFDLELYKSDPNLYADSPRFAAVGLSIYHANASGDGVGPKTVLWAYNNQYQSAPLYTSAELFLNLSTEHEYTLKFSRNVRDYNPSLSCQILVDEVESAVLHGIEDFHGAVNLALTVFNQNGFIPEIANPSDPPSVSAVFSNVHLPGVGTSLCLYGTPFHSWDIPFVRFEAGIGTSPELTDIKAFRVVSEPCVPCIPGPCEMYACNTSCTGEDPYIIGFSFSNLSIASFPISPYTDTPLTVYLTVQATTANGEKITKSSNGIVLDFTAPILVKDVVHFDVVFDTNQPIEFQSSNDTIAVEFEFADPESGIVEYSWAIGTEPFLTDIQNFTSVGLETKISNSQLSGLLTHNSTYYATVMAVNGAGLLGKASSNGVTYIATELNVTELASYVRVRSVESLSVPLASDRNLSIIFELGHVLDFASIAWNGVTEEVDQINWYLGTAPREEDILPSTLVSYGMATSAAIDAGALYIDRTIFATLSEVLALAEQKNPVVTDNLLSIEPGRTFYHTVEMCNVAHRCQEVVSSPGIIFRYNDHFSVAGEDGNVSVLLQQEQPVNQSISETPIADRRATLSISSTRALLRDSLFASGFLSDFDLQRYFRNTAPYTSNPYDTMGQTSVSVSRRFTSIGGPSFYVSFLGQTDLLSSLIVNVSFDSSLDWFNARPELLYWDTTEFVWREVRETCGRNSTIDWSSYTLQAELCSTVIEDTGVGRRRRQSDNETAPSFLDRPVHLIVGQIGSFSINTPPVLLFPTEAYQIAEYPTTFTLDLSSLYTDAEGDTVKFYLSSVPSLGSANLTESGTLVYSPCPNCIGIEMLEVYVLEDPFGINIRLSATGMLRLQINNINVAPNIFFYEELSTGNISLSSSSRVYLDNNRTDYTSVIQIGAYDLDGYNDKLTLRVIGAMNGDVQADIWLDAVGLSESLPVFWPPSAPGGAFQGYMTFLGVNLTYLPSNPLYTGEETLSISVKDEGSLFSNPPLSLTIVMFDSPCQNGGRCANGSTMFNCSCECPLSFSGEFCEIANFTSVPDIARVCPDGIPEMTCEDDPCREAMCPSNSSAVCKPNFCGSCTAEWFVGDERIQCNANDVPGVCLKPIDVTIAITCGGVTCDCPEPPFACPEDSILVEVRTSPCCVRYDCVCPQASCPVLMECGVAVQPVPSKRGHGYPGYCCPDYNFDDINECGIRNGLCSDICVNQPFTHQCTCPSGVTLASDQQNCGVCKYNDMEYLYGDRVKIGCNWCVCQSDNVSSERWRCTADPCTPSCLMNGSYYNIGHRLQSDLITCTCGPTDTGAEWSCEREDVV